MCELYKTVWGGRRKGILSDGGGNELTPPKGWEFLEAGDAGLTRRVKNSGPCWVVKCKRGKRVISLGIWAPAEIISEMRETLEKERSSPVYKKRLNASRKRRAEKEAEYRRTFHNEILAYLNFAPRYNAEAETIARAVTEHATPVGSGTVARTERIPLEKRAEAALIAWMRHKTTAYDTMSIDRVKGERRRVRRTLAQSYDRKIRLDFANGGLFSKVTSVEYRVSGCQLQA